MSYIIITPKYIKVGCDNQILVSVATAYQLVRNFRSRAGSIKITSFERAEKTEYGETRNVILAVSKKFPIGLGKLIITGSGGLNFEEKRDIIVYDNCHVILVQTSSSTYRPHDTMEIRVVVTNENLIPIEYGELIVEIYDAVFKLVGEFPNVPIHSGLTKVLRYPLAEHVNVGTWLVSATIGNTTSSIEVIVSCPLIPSFDVNAIFQRFLLRIDETLRGVIKINDDHNEPIFGRAIIAIGELTEQDIKSKMKMGLKEVKPKIEEWCK